MLLLAGTAVADDLQQQLHSCAAIENDSERLECFDDMAKGHAPPHDSTSDDIDDGEPEAESGPRQAERGATESTSPAIVSKEEKVFVVRLVRCSTPSSGGRQLYFFDNGEVWQQSNTSPTKIRNCDTEVNVRQDLFGYKMEVPSENRKIRIRPVR